MKEFSLIKTSTVFIEINAVSLKALKDGNRVELALERGPDSRLTQASRETITSGLRAFVNKKALKPRPRACCAIGAAGVSLRRVTLPATTKDEFEKVLRLQIEAEFPLSPEELAWGYFPLESKIAGKREVLVAAVKKEIIGEYADLLASCDLEPAFTLAALARNYLCPQPGGTHALLDTGNERPEWTQFENGIPASIRIFPPLSQVSLSDSVSKTLGPSASGKVIYLTGAATELADQLSRQLSGRVACLPMAAEVGAWSAVLGLKKAFEQDNASRLIMLETRAAKPTGGFNASSPEIKPWLARAAVLLCVLVLLPFAAALAFKPLLAKKLTALKAERGRLTTIDQEFEFLQSLKQTQPPYVDALYLMAKSAAPGTKFDSLTMDRQGNVSLHGNMQNGQQVTDFRASLISSGFFANVTVEEQSPTPDRQRVSVRMTAHWKSAEARAGLNTGPTKAEIDQAKTNNTAAGSGGMPAGMPPGMMPGMPMIMQR